MKKVFLITVSCVLFSTLIVAQSVGINTTTPHASAILDIKSSTKGMLTPRTSTASRIAIVNPAKGLMIYDTTTSSFWFYNGGTWTVVANGDNTWSLSGNTGINPVNHFIGTTDAQPLRFRVNNSWAGELHPTSGNIFLGLGSGQTNTGGVSNTAMGEHSLLANTDGNFNAAYGYEALSANTTGYNNTAQGSYSLYSNTVGSSNTAIGRNALFANTSGNVNTAIGADALLTNTVGNANTANAFKALYSNTTGALNTANGAFALYSNTTASYNTATGVYALYSNTTGDANTSNGAYALNSNTTGNKNTANGHTALLSNTTGYENTANGFEALYFNTTGYYNTATGVDALAFNTTGSENTANGYQALFSTTTGSLNTANGTYALYNNTTGAHNVANGTDALYFNTTGSTNIAIGVGALESNTVGSHNIAIGFLSGTGGPNAGNLTNTIGIGNDGGFLNGASNQVILGNASTVFIGGKVNWAVVSDARIKNSVEEDVKGLSFILKLRPVTYHISNKAIIDLTGNKDTTNFPGKYDGEKIKYTGFLAQEVEQAAKASEFDFSGYTAPKNTREMYTIRYAEFVVPLVKAVQEQQAIITNQQKQIDGLEKRLAALEAK